MEGLDHLEQLEELYVSHNGITEIENLQNLKNLKILDIGNNQISQLTGLENLISLQELWASNNQLTSFQEIEKELKDKRDLETVYFEGNPIQSDAGATYRLKLKTLLPQIKQIDATMVRVNE